MRIDIKTNSSIVKDQIISPVFVKLISKQPLNQVSGNKPTNNNKTNVFEKYDFMSSPLRIALKRISLYLQAIKPQIVINHNLMIIDTECCLMSVTH